MTSTAQPTSEFVAAHGSPTPGEITPSAGSGVPRGAGGLFSVIYADPAWSYNDKCHAGERGAGYKYTVTDTASICALPVAQIAAQNCALFMWATLPMLPDAMQVMKAWRFQYKTAAFVWVKTNKKADTDFFGMGNWTRANAELCLLGIRGRPKRICASVRQVVRSPIGKHSEKPAEVRDRIVTLMGDLPRVELFARVKTQGWSSWGNQIDSDISLGGGGGSETSHRHSESGNARLSNGGPTLL